MNALKKRAIFFLYGRSTKCDRYERIETLRLNNRKNRPKKPESKQRPYQLRKSGQDVTAHFFPGILFQYCTSNSVIAITTSFYRDTQT